MNAGRIITPDAKLKAVLPVAKVDMLKVSDFPELPSVSTDSFRILIRTLLGLVDFARTNAHYSRRRTPHPFYAVALGTVPAMLSLSPSTSLFGFKFQNGMPVVSFMVP